MRKYAIGGAIKDQKLFHKRCLKIELWTAKPSGILTFSRFWSQTHNSGEWFVTGLFIQVPLIRMCLRLNVKLWKLKSF